MEVADEVGLALRQLAAEQIPKEGVTAVRLAAPVEGGDQEVHALQRCEHARRALLRQNRVANRRRQLLEHRRPS